MNARRMVLIATVIALTFAGNAVAAKLDTPRPHDRVEGFFPVAPGDISSPLVIGKPSGLAMGNSWVTSDYSTDDNSTYPIWCDFEYLSVVGLFTTMSAKNVTASITVKTPSGALVHTDSFTAAPVVGVVLGKLFDVGPLPVGNYKVTYKFKQGDSVVGLSYWVYVVVCTR